MCDWAITSCLVKGPAWTLKRERGWHCPSPKSLTVLSAPHLKRAVCMSSVFYSYCTLSFYDIYIPSTGTIILYLYYYTPMTMWTQNSIKLPCPMVQHHASFCALGSTAILSISPKPLLVFSPSFGEFGIIVANLMFHTMLEISSFLWKILISQLLPQ